MQNLDEIIISAYVAEIANKMNLSEEQEIKLSRYPDEIVRKAYGRIQGKTLDNPFTYMFKICSKESDLQASQPKRNITRLAPTSGNAPTATSQYRDADLGITPSIDMSNEENIKRWEEYEEKAKLEWAEQSDFHRKLLAKRKEKYMYPLDENTPDSYLMKHTPQNLERWRARAKETQKQGFISPSDVLKFNPESTTLNEIMVEQPKTQDVKENSTESNVVDILTPIEKMVKDLTRWWNTPQYDFVRKVYVEIYGEDVINKVVVSLGLT